MMAVTMTLVAAERRGTVMGLIAVVMAVGPALGPTVAGAVLSAASWHAIFWVMLPLVAASGLLGLARLRNVGTPRRLPLDVVSVVLSVLAFGGLIYGLSSIGQILAGGSAAVVALVLFALRQIRRARTGEVLSAFLTSAGLVGIALVLSLFIRAPRSGSRTEIEG